MRGKVVGALVAGVVLAGSWVGIGSALANGEAHNVGVVTETFVDRSRPTAANGDCDKIASRTVPTTIYYPAAGELTRVPAVAQPSAAPDASGGPYPLIVFAHGYGATARTYQPLLESLATAGYVVAAPTFPLSSGDSPCGAIAGDFVMAGTLQKYPKGRYDFAHSPPLLLVHGSNDSLVPYDLGVQAFNEARGPKGLLTMVNGDHGSSSGAGTYIAARDFFDAYLRGDAAAKARLPTDQDPGRSTMQFDAQKGSTTTIPTVPRPVQNLKATVTPRKNLTGGQMVTVQWSGYTPGKVVNILQCNGTNRDLSNSAACDYANAKLLYPNPTGNGEVQLTIVEGAVGTGVCDARHPKCIIVVNNASSSDPRDNVIVDIALKQ